MIRLGVNIDHVATLRQARGEKYPDPVEAAMIAVRSGADNITCHLREDRRHIQDRDVRLLREILTVPLNFEIAATTEMVGIARDLRPAAVCLVPEKREELTTEGGLDVSTQTDWLKRVCGDLREAGSFVVLFVEPCEKAIEMAHTIGAQGVEIHTGDFCRRISGAVQGGSGEHFHSPTHPAACLRPLISAAKCAASLGLAVQVGHGLNYQNAHWMQQVPHVVEANIGHAIVSHAVFAGLADAVKEMKILLNDNRYGPRFADAVDS